MAKLILKLPLLLLILALLPGAQFEPLSGHASGLDTALKAVSLSAAVTGALLAVEEAPPGILRDGGCYVWQQPGAALVVNALWREGDAKAPLWYSPDRLHGFLKALGNRKWEAPFLHPGEAGNVDEFYVEPAVYLLTAEQAQFRLNQYKLGYESWISFNEGMNFIRPSKESLRVDFAVVYLESAGPLEFHFRYDEEGRLRLTHLFLWEFFSA